MPETTSFNRIADDVELGNRVIVFGFSNLYGCTIGDETKIGAFVEIQRGVTIGSRCKISSHTFVCGGVTIEDEVFIGHGVCFTNDRYPRAITEQGALKSPDDWTEERTIVRRGASIGSGSVILPGIEIGARSIVGAGSVVIRSVEPGEVVSGSPARPHSRDATGGPLI